MRQFCNTYNEIWQLFSFLTMCTSIRFCLLIRTFPFEIFLWVRFLCFYFFTLIHFIFQLRLNPNESQRNITRQRILSLIRKKIGELELTKGTLQTNRAVAKKKKETKRKTTLRQTCPQNMAQNNKVVYINST